MSKSVERASWSLLQLDTQMKKAKKSEALKLETLRETVNETVENLKSELEITKTKAERLQESFIAYKELQLLTRDKSGAKLAEVEAKMDNQIKIIKENEIYLNESLRHESGVQLMGAIETGVGTGISFLQGKAGETVNAIKGMTTVNKAISFRTELDTKNISKALETYRENVKQKGEVYTKAKQDYERAKEEFEIKEREISKAEAKGEDVGALKIEAEQLKAKRDTAKDAFTEAKNRWDNAKREIRQNVIEAENAYFEARDKVREAEGKVKELEKEVEELGKVEVDKEEKTSAEKELETAKAKEGVTEAELKTAQDKLKTAKKELETANGELKSAKAKEFEPRDLKTEMEQKGKEREKLENKLKEAEGEKAKLEKDEKELKEMDAEIAGLQKELEGKEAELKKETNEAVKETLNNDIEGIMERLPKLQDLKNEKIEVIEAKKLETDQKLKEKEIEITNLKKELEPYEIYKTNTQLIQDLTAQTESYKTTVEKHKQTIQAVEPAAAQGWRSVKGVLGKVRDVGVRDVKPIKFMTKALSVFGPRGVSSVASQEVVVKKFKRKEGKSKFGGKYNPFNYKFQTMYEKSSAQKFKDLVLDPSNTSVQATEARLEAMSSMAGESFGMSSIHKENIKIWENALNQGRALTASEIRNTEPTLKALEKKIGIDAVLDFNSRTQAVLHAFNVRENKALEAEINRTAINAKIGAHLDTVVMQNTKYANNIIKKYEASSKMLEKGAAAAQAEQDDELMKMWEESYREQYSITPDKASFESMKYLVHNRLLGLGQKSKITASEIIEAIKDPAKQEGLIQRAVDKQAMQEAFQKIVPERLNLVYDAVAKSKGAITFEQVIEAIKDPAKREQLLKVNESAKPALEKAFEKIEQSKADEIVNQDKTVKAYIAVVHKLMGADTAGAALYAKGISSKEIEKAYTKAEELVKQERGSIKDRIVERAKGLFPKKAKAKAKAESFRDKVIDAMVKEMGGTEKADIAVPILKEGFNLILKQAGNGTLVRQAKVIQNIESGKTKNLARNSKKIVEKLDKGFDDQGVFTGKDVKGDNVLKNLNKPELDEFSKMFGMEPRSLLSKSGNMVKKILAYRGMIIMGTGMLTAGILGVVGVATGQVYLGYIAFGIVMLSSGATALNMVFKVKVGKFFIGLFTDIKKLGFKDTLKKLVDFKANLAKVLKFIDAHKKAIGITAVVITAVVTAAVVIAISAATGGTGGAIFSGLINMALQMSTNYVSAGAWLASGVLMGGGSFAWMGYKLYKERSLAKDFRDMAVMYMSGDEKAQQMFMQELKEAGAREGEIRQAEIAAEKVEAIKGAQGVKSIETDLRSFLKENKDDLGIKEDQIEQIVKDTVLLMQKKGKGDVFDLLKQSIEIQIKGALEPTVIELIKTKMQFKQSVDKYMQSEYVEIIIEELKLEGKFVQKFKENLAQEFLKELAKSPKDVEAVFITSLNEVSKKTTEIESAIKKIREKTSADKEALNKEIKTNNEKLKTLEKDIKELEKKKDDPKVKEELDKKVEEKTKLEEQIKESEEKLKAKKEVKGDLALSEFGIKTADRTKAFETKAKDWNEKFKQAGKEALKEYVELVYGAMDAKELTDIYNKIENLDTQVDSQKAEDALFRDMYEKMFKVDITTSRIVNPGQYARRMYLIKTRMFEEIIKSEPVKKAQAERLFNRLYRNSSENVLSQKAMEAIYKKTGTSLEKIQQIDKEYKNKKDQQISKQVEIEAIQTDIKNLKDENLELEKQKELDVNKIKLNNLKIQDKQTDLSNAKKDLETIIKDKIELAEKIAPESAEKINKETADGIVESAREKIAEKLTNTDILEAVKTEAETQISTIDTKISEITKDIREKEYKPEKEVKAIEELKTKKANLESQKKELKRIITNIEQMTMDPKARADKLLDYQLQKEKPGSKSRDYTSYYEAVGDLQYSVDAVAFDKMEELFGLTGLETISGNMVYKQAQKIIAEDLIPKLSEAANQNKGIISIEFLDSLVTGEEFNKLSPQAKRARELFVYSVKELIKAKGWGGGTREKPIISTLFLLTQSRYLLEAVTGIGKTETITPLYTALSAMMFKSTKAHALAQFASSSHLTDAASKDTRIFFENLNKNKDLQRIMGTERVIEFKTIEESALHDEGKLRDLIDTVDRCHASKTALVLFADAMSLQSLELAVQTGKEPRLASLSKKVIRQNMTMLVDEAHMLGDLPSLIMGMGKERRLTRTNIKSSERAEKFLVKFINHLPQTLINAGPITEVIDGNNISVKFTKDTKNNIVVSLEINGKLEKTITMGAKDKILKQLNADGSNNLSASPKSAAHNYIFDTMLSHFRKTYMDSAGYEGHSTFTAAKKFWGRGGYFDKASGYNIFAWRAVNKISPITMVKRLVKERKLTSPIVERQDFTKEPKHEGIIGDLVKGFEAFKVQHPTLTKPFTQTALRQAETRRSLNALAQVLGSSIGQSYNVVKPGGKLGEEVIKNAVIKPANQDITSTQQQFSDPYLAGVYETVMKPILGRREAASVLEKGEGFVRREAIKIMSSNIRDDVTDRLKQQGITDSIRIEEIIAKEAEVKIEKIAKGMKSNKPYEAVLQSAIKNQYKPRLKEVELSADSLSSTVNGIISQAYKYGSDVHFMTGTTMLCSKGLEANYGVQPEIKLEQYCKIFGNDPQLLMKNLLNMNPLTFSPKGLELMDALGEFIKMNKVKYEKGTQFKEWMPEFEQFLKSKYPELQPVLKKLLPAMEKTEHAPILAKDLLRENVFKEIVDKIDEPTYKDFRDNVFEYEASSKMFDAFEANGKFKTTPEFEALPMDAKIKIIDAFTKITKQDMTADYDAKIKALEKIDITPEIQTALQAIQIVQGVRVFTMPELMRAIGEQNEVAYTAIKKIAVLTGRDQIVVQSGTLDGSFSIKKITKSGKEESVLFEITREKLEKINEGRTERLESMDVVNMFFEYVRKNEIEKGMTTDKAKLESEKLYVEKLLVEDPSNIKLQIQQGDLAQKIEKQENAIKEFGEILKTKEELFDKFEPGISAKIEKINGGLRESDLSVVCVKLQRFGWDPKGFKDYARTTTFSLTGETTTFSDFAQSHGRDREPGQTAHKRFAILTKGLQDKMQGIGGEKLRVEDFVEILTRNEQAKKQYTNYNQVKESIVRVGIEIYKELLESNPSPAMKNFLREKLAQSQRQMGGSQDLSRTTQSAIEGLRTALKDTIEGLEQLYSMMQKESAQISRRSSGAMGMMQKMGGPGIIDAGLGLAGIRLAKTEGFSPEIMEYVKAQLDYFKPEGTKRVRTELLTGRKAGETTPATAGRGILSNASNLIKVVETINQVIDPRVDLPKEVSGGKPSRPAQIYSSRQAKSAATKIEKNLQTAGFGKMKVGRTFFKRWKAGRKIEQNNFRGAAASMISDMARREDMQDVMTVLTPQMALTIYDQAMKDAGEDKTKFVTAFTDRLEQVIQDNEKLNDILKDEKKKDKFKLVMAMAVISKLQETDGAAITGELIKGLESYVLDGSKLDDTEKQAFSNLLYISADLRLAEDDNRKFVDNAYPVMKDMGVDMSIYSVTDLINFKYGKDITRGFENWSDFAVSSIMNYGKDADAKKAVRLITDEGPEGVTIQKIKSVVEIVYADKTDEQKKEKTLNFVRVFTGTQVEESDYNALEILTANEEQSRQNDMMQAFMAMQAGKRAEFPKTEDVYLTSAWNRMQKAVQGGAKEAGRMAEQNITDMKKVDFDILIDNAGKEDKTAKAIAESEAKEVARYIKSIHGLKGLTNSEMQRAKRQIPGIFDGRIEITKDGVFKVNGTKVSEKAMEEVGADTITKIYKAQENIIQYSANAGIDMKKKEKKKVVNVVMEQIMQTDNKGAEAVGAWEKQLNIQLETKKKLGIETSSIKAKLFDTDVVSVVSGEEVNNMVIEINIDKLQDKAKTEETFAALAFLANAVKGIVITSQVDRTRKAVTSLEELSKDMLGITETQRTAIDQGFETAFDIITSNEIGKFAPASKIMLASARAKDSYLRVGPSEELTAPYITTTEAMINGKFTKTHVVDLKGLFIGLGFDAKDKKVEEYINKVRSSSERKLQWDNRFVEIGDYEEYVLLLLDLLSLFSDEGMDDSKDKKLMNAHDILNALVTEIHNYEQRKKTEALMQARTMTQKLAEQSEEFIKSRDALSASHITEKVQNLEKSMQKITEYLKQNAQYLDKTKIEQIEKTENMDAKLKLITEYIETEAKMDTLIIMNDAFEAYQKAIKSGDKDAMNQTFNQYNNAVLNAFGMSLTAKQTQQRDTVFAETFGAKPAVAVTPAAPAVIPAKAGIPEKAKPEVIKASQELQQQTADRIKSASGLQGVSIVYDNKLQSIMLENPEYDADGNIKVTARVPAGMIDSRLTREQLRQNENLINNAVLVFKAFSPARGMTGMDLDYIELISGKEARQAYEAFEQQLYPDLFARMIIEDSAFLDEVLLQKHGIDMAFYLELDKLKKDKNYTEMRDKIRDAIRIKPEMLLMFRESSAECAGVAEAIAGTWNNRSSELDKAFSAIQKLRVHCNGVSFTNRVIRFAYIVNKNVCRAA
ncbi:hypothetical protein KKC59_04040 [bacterium]|nr:hypothetical protein [bacterium]